MYHRKPIYNYNSHEYPRFQTLLNTDMGLVEVFVSETSDRQTKEIISEIVSEVDTSFFPVELRKITKCDVFLTVIMKEGKPDVYDFFIILDQDRNMWCCLTKRKQKGKFFLLLKNVDAFTYFRSSSTYMSVGVSRKEKVKLIRIKEVEKNGIKKLKINESKTRTIAKDEWNVDLFNSFSSDISYSVCDRSHHDIKAKYHKMMMKSSTEVDMVKFLITCSGYFFNVLSRNRSLYAIIKNGSSNLLVEEGVNDISGFFNDVIIATDKGLSLVKQEVTNYNLIRHYCSVDVIEIIDLYRHECPIVSIISPEMYCGVSLFVDENSRLFAIDLRGEKKAYPVLFKGESVHVMKNIKYRKQPNIDIDMI